MFLFTAPRRAVAPTEPEIKSDRSVRAKRSEHEADHSSPSGSEVKNAWNYTPTPLCVFILWCSIKDREKAEMTEKDRKRDKDRKKKREEKIKDQKREKRTQNKN
jgi:hypothetical protein